MTTTTVIPLTTLPPGQLTFGPSNVADSETRIVLAIDRTVTGGLNSLTPATRVAVDVQQSDDGGATWFLAVGGTFPGGFIQADKAGDPVTVNILNVDVYPGTGRKLKAVVTVTGSPVAVAGTLTSQ